MPDFSSGTLFYRAIDVVPVLTPELEKEIAALMDEARAGMLSALLQSPGGERFFLEPLLALAEGRPSESEILDKGYWGIRDGILPEGRRRELKALCEDFAGGGVSPGAAAALHPNWAFVEKSGQAFFDRPDRAGGDSAAEDSFRKARLKQSEAMEKLVESNIRLVVKLARRYGKLAPVEEMDLVQEGCEGLISAARRFDFHRGFRFSTYAVWWIRQAIVKSLMRSARLIRIPAHASMMKGEIGRARHRYLERHGCYPSEEELVDEVGITLDMLRAVYWSSIEPLSLDKALGEDSDSTVHDLIDSTRPGTGAVYDAMRRDLRERVDRALEKLDGRERMILMRKYGLDGGEPSTLAQIGRDLALSRERVRQLEARALDKLRKLGLLFPEDCDEIG